MGYVYFINTRLSNTLYVIIDLGKLIENTAIYNAWERNETGTYNGSTFTGDDVLLHDGRLLIGGILSVSFLFCFMYYKICNMLLL